MMKPSGAKTPGVRMTAHGRARGEDRPQGLELDKGWWGLNSERRRVGPDMRSSEGRSAGAAEGAQAGAQAGRCPRSQRGTPCCAGRSRPGRLRQPSEPLRDPALDGERGPDGGEGGADEPKHRSAQARGQVLLRAQQVGGREEARTRRRRRVSPAWWRDVSKDAGGNLRSRVRRRKAENSCLVSPFSPGSRFPRAVSRSPAEFSRPTFRAVTALRLRLDSQTWSSAHLPAPRSGSPCGSLLLVPSC